MTETPKLTDKIGNPLAVGSRVAFARRTGNVGVLSFAEVIAATPSRLTLQTIPLNRVTYRAPNTVIVVVVPDAPTL